MKTSKTSDNHNKPEKTERTSRKKSVKKAEPQGIPGFAYYQLYGEQVISNLCGKPKVLAERNGKYLLLNNQDKRQRLSLDELKQMAETGNS